MAIFYKDGGFYSDDFEGFVPENAVEITAEEHLALLEEQTKGLVISEKDGKPILIEQAVQFDLNSAKSNALSKLSDKTDRLKASLLQGYPQAEIDSFYRQEQEARAYLAGTNETPEMLTQIVQMRGIPLNLLAQAVVRKGDQLATVIGTILGIKQKFETGIEQAESLDELAKVETEIEQWQLSI